MPLTSKTYIPDGIDIEIIKRLADNARQSVSSLANQIGMSAPSIAERIKNARRTGSYYSLYHLGRSRKTRLYTHITGKS
ncbi:AsnC family transcriptional regulator [Aliamphritea ceti]|uniref:AsnC family transcriptional regulator n=1 Tax=Aliamphritea ceti TaxID=1524258 RepID=UPI0035E3FD66